MLIKSARKRARFALRVKRKGQPVIPECTGMLLFFCHSHFLIYFHVRLDGFFFSVFPETNHTKQFSTKTSWIRDFRIFDPCIKENKFLAVVGLPCEFQWEPFSLVEGLFMFKYEYVCFLGSREQIQFSSPSFSLSFSISSNSNVLDERRNKVAA